MFVSLKFHLKFDAVLYIFHEECAAMMTMKHKLAYIDAKALRYRGKLDDPFPFYRNFDDAKYLFDLGVRLTEFSVTVESVTLRFYCNLINVWHIVCALCVYGVL